MSDAFKAEKMADDPEFDNIWNLAARWHLKFMKGANAQLNSGNVDFRTPHYIKTFHEIKRFGNVEPDADDCKPVKEAYDAFMKRLKKVVNDNVNYRNLLKEIDEYVAPSAVPPIAEEFFWKNGWGATEQVIVQNLSKFYAPINVNGVFRIKHKGPDGKDEFFKKEDFINMFRSKCILITVKTATGTNYHVLKDDLFGYWLIWCRTVGHKNTFEKDSFGSVFKEFIPALDDNGRVARHRNGAIFSLVEQGRQSTGDREYFHRIPEMDLCRALWDKSWDAQYEWDDTTKWEKLDLAVWLNKRRDILNNSTPF
jgi:hypothetical protein